MGHQKSVKGAFTKYESKELSSSEASARRLVFKMSETSKRLNYEIKCNYTEINDEKQDSQSVKYELFATDKKTSETCGVFIISRGDIMSSVLVGKSGVQAREEVERWLETDAQKLNPSDPLNKDSINNKF